MEANVSEMEIALTAPISLSLQAPAPLLQTPRPVDSSLIFLPGIRRGIVRGKKKKKILGACEGSSKKVVSFFALQRSHSRTNHGEGPLSDARPLTLEASLASAVAGSPELAARARAGAQIAPSPLQENQEPQLTLWVPGQVPFKPGPEHMDPNQRNPPPLPTLPSANTLWPVTGWANRQSPLPNLAGWPHT